MPGAATASRWPPECIGGEPGTTFAYGSDELSGGIFFNPGTSTPIVSFDSDKEDADVLLSTPRKQLRRARGMDFALGTHKLPTGRERGSRASRVKERSPSPEGSDSSLSSNVPFYSCESSFSPSSTSPLRISLRGSVTAFHTPSCDISSQLLSPITPSLTRSTKSHILTPDSTHLTPTSRQLNDVLLRPALRQLPNVKLSVVEPTGLLTPEPTPNREKLQCQGLTGEKIQCKRWKLDAEGTVYFCKSHQAQSGSPLHERVARSKEEELARSNKPGQCHGLNRRRVQCRSPAVTGSEGSNGFCFHHKNQQHSDRPGLVNLESRAEGDANNGANRRGTSTLGPALEDKKPRQMAKTRAKPVVQGRRTSSSRKKTPNLPGDAGADQEAAQRNYIPSYMTGEAREALLVKMNTPEKSVDEGYIYVCEVTAKETEKNVPADHIVTRSEQHMYIKVGCTKRPARRAKDWQKKCSANNFEPHGIWPKYEGTLSGIEYGDPFLYKYLPERLIKHELEYLAQSSAHLPEGERPVAPAQEICSCKEPRVVHTEIYAIARYGAGDGSENNKKLWDFIDEIVQRWTQFAVRYHKMPRRLYAAS